MNGRHVFVRVRRAVEQITNRHVICEMTDGVSQLLQLSHLLRLHQRWIIHIYISWPGNSQQASIQVLGERWRETRRDQPLNTINSLCIVIQHTVYSLVSGGGAWGEITTSYVTGLLMSLSSIHKWSVWYWFTGVWRQGENKGWCICASAKNIPRARLLKWKEMVPKRLLSNRRLAEKISF